MGFVFAALHWTPPQFMAATNHEIFAGYEMWRKMNCVEED